MERPFLTGLFFVAKEPVTRVRLNLDFRSPVIGPTVKEVSSESKAEAERPARVRSASAPP